MKKKIIIGSIIAVVVIAFIAVNVLRNTGAIAAFGDGKAISVKVKKIEKGDIQSVVSASGMVEEISKSEIYFEAPVKAEKVLVAKNQKVSKGQKLIELDMDSLNSELAQLKITKATQELSIQKLLSQDITKGIASLEVSLSVSQNNLESAKKNLEDAKKNLTESEVLFKAGALSQSELDRAEKAVSDGEISVKNAEANVNLALDNINETKKSNSEAASAKNIDIETLRKNLDATNLRIADTEKKIKSITESTFSPIDGVITEKNVEDGGTVNSAQPTFRIINPENLQIKADVKEFDIKHVSVGQSVKITGDAIAKDIVITGKVSAVSPVAKKSMTTSGEETFVEVTVAIEESNPVLKSGLSVTCDIVAQEKKSVPLASFEMLKEDKDGNKFVYVLDEKEGVIHEKKVKLGISSDLDVEVEEGINEGDMVVLDPLPNYKDGTKAKVVNENKK